MLAHGEGHRVGKDGKNPVKAIIEAEEGLVERIEELQ